MTMTEIASSAFSGVRKYVASSGFSNNSNELSFSKKIILTYDDINNLFGSFVNNRASAIQSLIYCLDIDKKNELISFVKNIPYNRGKFLDDYDKFKRSHSVVEKTTVEKAPLTVKTEGSLAPVADGTTDGTTDGSLAPVADGTTEGSLAPVADGTTDGTTEGTDEEQTVGGKRKVAHRKSKKSHRKSKNPHKKSYKKFHKKPNKKSHRKSRKNKRFAK